MSPAQKQWSTCIETLRWSAGSTDGGWGGMGLGFRLEDGAPQEPHRL